MMPISTEQMVDLACALSSGGELSAEEAKIARRMRGDRERQAEMEGWSDFLRVIRRAVAGTQAKRSPEGGPCVEDETLAAYVDGTLGEAEREAAELHFSRCRGCLNQLLELRGIVKEAASGYEGGRSLRYVVEVARRGVRLLVHPENGFLFLDPKAVAVLSSGERSPAELQQCCTWRQYVCGCSVVIAVVQTGDEYVNVSLTVTDASLPVARARITLRRDGHIVQSESTSEAGRVSLHNLEIGVYECDMRLPGSDLKAQFTLDFRESVS